MKPTPQPRPRIRLVALTLLSGLLPPCALSARARAADVPKLAGNWTWSWKDPAGATHRHILEVEGVGAKLAARERFDDLPAVRVADLKLDGKDVRFSVVRDQRRADYRGVVDGDGATINGTVTVTSDGESNEFVWKAAREPAAKEPVRDR
jgi:hypothetical protein